MSCGLELKPTVTRGEHIRRLTKFVGRANLSQRRRTKTELLNVTSGKNWNLLYAVFGVYTQT